MGLRITVMSALRITSLGEIQSTSIREDRVFQKSIANESSSVCTCRREIVGGKLDRILFI